MSDVSRERQLGKKKNKFKHKKPKQQAQARPKEIGAQNREVISAEDSAATAATSEKEGENKEEHFVGLRELANRSSLTDYIIALFTLVLAGCAIYQFVIMSGQLDAMRKDQRPWLKLTFELNPVAVNSPVSGIMRLSNGGKTPAREVKADVVIEWVTNGQQPVFDYAFPHGAATTGTVFPNEAPIGVPIVRTQFVGAGPASENEIVSQAKFDQYMGIKIFLVVYATVTYKDFFGNDHWTKTCAFYSPPSAVGNVTAQKCTNYGDIDNN
jgi:hypothetical protein